MSKNLKQHIRKVIDKTYSRDNIIEYCENLLLNPPLQKDETIDNIELRDYQIEAITMIKEKNQNITICLPTGTGKKCNYMFIF